jgi:hypothetical protein
LISNNDSVQKTATEYFIVRISQNVLDSIKLSFVEYTHGSRITDTKRGCEMSVNCRWIFLGALGISVKGADAEGGLVGKMSEEDPGQSAKELVSSGHVDVPKF